MLHKKIINLVPLIIGFVFLISAIKAMADQSNGQSNPGNNQIIYTPRPGFIGTDRFQYEVSDGRGGKKIVNVIVNVLPRGPSASSNNPTLDNTTVEIEKVDNRRGANPFSSTNPKGDSTSSSTSSNPSTPSNPGTSSNPGTTSSPTCTDHSGTYTTTFAYSGSFTTDQTVQESTLLNLPFSNAGRSKTWTGSGCTATFGIINVVNSSGNFTLNITVSGSSITGTATSGTTSYTLSATFSGNNFSGTLQATDTRFTQFSGNTIPYTITANKS